MGGCAHSHLLSLIAQLSVTLRDWCCSHDLFAKLITVNDPVSLICHSFDPRVSAYAAPCAVHSFKELIFAENFHGVVTFHRLDFFICVDLRLPVKHGSKFENSPSREVAHRCKGWLKVLVLSRDFQKFVEAAFLKNAIKGLCLHVALTLAAKNRKHP